jgi:hypothetical protein
MTRPKPVYVVAIYGNDKAIDMSFATVCTINMSHSVI